MSKTYFEILYKGPYKGVDVSMPEDCIPRGNSPYMVNMILKNGEIRTRPRQYNLLPGTPDGRPILVITSFRDSNNVYHTVAVTSTGLWQLNRSWNKFPSTAKSTWSLVGNFVAQPGPNLPAATAVFVDKFFWTNGGVNLWQWDGISSAGVPTLWAANAYYLKGQQVIDANGNLQVAGNSGQSGNTVPTWSSTLGATTADTNTSPALNITWTENGKNISSPVGFVNAGIVDATNGGTAGAYFLIELNAQLLMLSTVESQGGAFPQRVRWTPSGLPTIWDPNVNIGAGFNDELDVPDSITGAMTVGTTGFIFRNNGITELTSTGNGINPWDFNHLWASDRGIGNVFPFGYASYGPLGIFISSDDIYNVSLGGFKKIGGIARDAIFDDLYATTGLPIGSIVPYYQGNYAYNHYRLSIPQGNNNVWWVYSIEDDAWVREENTNKNFTGIARWSFTQ